MKLRFVRLVVVVSAFILSGAPTVMMQIGAWGLMIGQRSERQAVADIVRVVFLGTEPCQRCEVIENGAGKDQQRGMDFRELTGMQLISLRRETAMFVNRGLEYPLMIFPIEFLRPGDRSDSPPTPPPRRIIVS